MYISKITLTNKGYSLIDNISKNNSTSIKNNNSNQQNHTGISLPLNYYTHLNYYSKPLSFMGKNVYIVDGGTHATNMEHFAHAISKDMDTEIFEVSTIYNNPNMKSLKGLEMQLRNLRKNRNLKNAYVAVPALASVPLLNIQDQYNAVMNDNKKFTPENIKSHKKQILDFLKVIYHAPNNYRKYIDYMDKNRRFILHIKYTYSTSIFVEKFSYLRRSGACYLDIRPGELRFMRSAIQSAGYFGTLAGRSLHHHAQPMPITKKRKALKLISKSAFGL